MLGEDHDKIRKQQPSRACHTQSFCRPLLSAVLLHPKADALRDRNQQIHY